ETDEHAEFRTRGPPAGSHPGVHSAGSRGALGRLLLRDHHRQRDRNDPGELRLGHLAHRRRHSALGPSGSLRDDHRPAGDELRAEGTRDQAPQMSTHARPLAVWLAAATDPQLSALLEARGVRPDVPWADFFDAAQALLDPASIERMLPHLTLAAATALRRAVRGKDAGEEADALVALALLQPDGTVPPSVVDAVAAREIPTTPEAPGGGPASEQAAARAAERAFTTVAAIADLLLLAADTPLALLTTGNLAAGEGRRIIEAGTAGEGLDDLVVIALEAGVLAADTRRLRPTRAG